MTRTSELIRDLRSGLPVIEPALRGSNLAQPFEAELAALAGSIAQARQVFVDPTKIQLAGRNIMSKLTSHRRTLEILYASINDEWITHQPEAPETAFEDFDNKANQLFSILSRVLKTQKEMQSAIERNIL